MKQTFCELFAGVGGFRLGLEESGWDCAFSNQYEPATKVQHASDTEWIYVAKSFSIPSPPIFSVPI